MGYEVFERTSVRVDEPSVSLGPSGAIALNAAASRILMGAGIRAVLLLWDGARRKVAIRAAPKADKNTYAVSFSRLSSCTIRAKAFLEFIGWDAPQRKMFPATWNGKERMLEVTLPPHNSEPKKSRQPSQRGTA